MAASVPCSHHSPEGGDRGGEGQALPPRAPPCQGQSRDCRPKVDYYSVIEKRKMNFFLTLDGPFACQPASGHLWSLPFLVLTGSQGSLAPVSGTAGEGLGYKREAQNPSTCSQPWGNQPLSGPAAPVAGLADPAKRPAPEDRKWGQP